MLFYQQLEFATYKSEETAMAFKVAYIEGCFSLYFICFMHTDMFGSIYNVSKDDPNFVSTS